MIETIFKIMGLVGLVLFVSTGLAIAFMYWHISKGDVWNRKH